MPDPVDLDPESAAAREQDREQDPAPDTAPRGHLSADERRARERRAAQLRVAGYEYREIARILGFRDQSGAYKAVNRVRQAAVREVGAELIALELERFDTLQRAAMTKAVAGDARAINAALRVMEQRARLTGLYEARDQARVGEARDAFAAFLGAAKERVGDDPTAPAETSEDAA